MAFDILRLFHIGCAAFWLASMLKDIFAPMTLTGDRDRDLVYITRREKTAGLFGTISGLGTIISGLTLMWMIGFDDNPWALDAGATGALVLGCLGAFGNGGSYHKIIQALEKRQDDVAILPLLTRHRQINLVMVALWLVVFLLMGLRHHL